MDTAKLDGFTQRMLAQGFDEVLVREWAPGFENAPHEHPFDTEALVVQGEFWLTVDGQTRRVATGDTFALARGIRHSERYGPEGATFWAARKN